MAVRFHWVRLRASCHATEDPERVAQAIAFVAGADVAGLAMERTELLSHYGGLVTLLEARIEKSRGARDVLGRLAGLPGARDALAASVDARVDDDGVFYARADKQAAYEGRLELTQGEDCVQVRWRAETYPATREAAVAAMKEALRTQ